MRLSCPDADDGGGSVPDRPGSAGRCDADATAPPLAIDAMGMPSVGALLGANGESTSGSNGRAAGATAGVGGVAGVSETGTGTGLEAAELGRGMSMTVTASGETVWAPLPF